MAAAPQLIPSVVPFRLPVRASALAAFGGAAARRRPLRATDEVSNEHPTILVVEPDERTRSLLLAGLSQEGFEVLAAASLEEAMRYLQPDRALPAMIFCEADLRSGDGFSLCQQVRSEQRTADLPVVLLSHTPESFHRELAGGVGADQYLPKPLYLNDVVALAKLMAGSSSTAPRFVSDTATLPISHALRALLSGVRAGRIELSQSKGWIAFREGRVVDAAVEGLRGEDALVRVLLFGHGEYSVTFGPALTRATMTFGLEELCRRLMPRIRRWQSLIGRSVPLEAVLVVDFAQLKAALEVLPDDVNRVLRLFDGRRTVRDAVLETGLDEVVALEAITRLYAMSVLTALHAENVTRTVVAAPTFFEPAGAITPTHVAELERTLFGAAETDASTATLGAESNGTPESIFTATGTLDADMIRQLEAFRIKPVVETPDVAPRSQPASAELASFASDSALHGAVDAQTPTALEKAVATEVAEPASLGAAVTPEAASATLEPIRLTAQVVDVPASAHVAGAQVSVEDSFFSAAEDTADLSPVVQQAPARRSLVVPLLVVGALAIAAVSVATFAGNQPRSKAEVATAPVVAPAVVVAQPVASPAPETVAAAASPAAPEGARASEVLPASAEVAAEAPASPAVAAAQPAHVVPAAAAAPEFTEVELAGSAASAVAAATKLYEARQYREAIAMLEEITGADPTVAQAWLLMGLARFDKGDRRGAEKATMEALAIEPTNGRALILLASIYLEQGQDAKAKVELKRYLELHPKGPFAAEARELLGR